MATQGAREEVLDQTRHTLRPQVLLRLPTVHDCLSESSSRIRSVLCPPVPRLIVTRARAVDRWRHLLNSKLSCSAQRSFHRSFMVMFHAL